LLKARWAFLTLRSIKAMNIALKNQLLEAIKLAKTGNWDASHSIVQDYNDTVSCWIHATLHKIEGDEGNSRYWYARCNARFEDYAETSQELEAIGEFLI
jgi:C1A family cysteine protease